MPIDGVILNELPGDWLVALASVAGLAAFSLALSIVQSLWSLLRYGVDGRPAVSEWVVEAEAVAHDAGVEDDADWRNIRKLFESRADRMQSLSASHARAGQAVEAAEYMLDRLLDECAGALLAVEDVQSMHKRRAAIAAKSGPVEALAA